MIVGEDGSPTIRGRGLKQDEHGAYIEWTEVAHYTWAWIETGSSPYSSFVSMVAHYTWAWIETRISAIFCAVSDSRPLYVGVD